MIPEKIIEVLKYEGVVSIVTQGKVVHVANTWNIKNRGGKGGIFFVPKDEYFFLGDNRSGSNDSRHWINTTIPTKDIQGKVILSLYPFHKI